jgi:hypothetical protein
VVWLNEQCCCVPAGYAAAQNSSELAPKYWGKAPTVVDAPRNVSDFLLKPSTCQMDDSAPAPGAGPDRRETGPVGAYSYCITCNEGLEGCFVKHERFAT